MSGLTAAIVEKEFLVAADLKQQLKTIGFNVNVYRSIDEAVAASRTDLPKVLLLGLDSEDPDYDIAAAGKIQSEFGVYVIYTVTDINSEIIRKMESQHSANKYSCIKKPFLEKDLIEPLKQAVWSLRTNP